MTDLVDRLGCIEDLDSFDACGTLNYTRPAMREARVIDIVRDSQEDDAYHRLEELQHLRVELLILTKTKESLRPVSDSLW